MYAGKTLTNSNIAWHRPQSIIDRVEHELIESSSKALNTSVDPVERVRLLCLSKGACGIMHIAKVFRRMDSKDSNYLNIERMHDGLKEVGVDLSIEELEELFAKLDPGNNGTISIDDFINHIRPPMSDSRCQIVRKAFTKLDKGEKGVITFDDLRGVYDVTSQPRYMSGEESSETVLDRFMANFHHEETGVGHITLEDFMNYYSGIGASIDNDCYFDLVMRQAYKL